MNIAQCTNCGIEQQCNWGDPSNIPCNNCNTGTYKIKPTGCLPRNILQMALDVHGTTVGHYERSQQEQDLDIKYLTNRIKDWRTYDDMPGHKFDFAVKQLVLAALEEEERSRVKE